MKLALALVVALALMASTAQAHTGGSHASEDNCTMWRLEAKLVNITAPAVMPKGGLGACHVYETKTKGTFIASLDIRSTINVTVAHIHYSPPGATTGPVILTLLGKQSVPITVGQLNTRVVFGGAELIATNGAIFNATDGVEAACSKFMMAGDGGMLYCNVHTVVNAGGETRGNLMKAMPTMAPMPSNKKAPPQGRSYKAPRKHNMHHDDRH